MFRKLRDISPSCETSTALVLALDKDSEVALSLDMRLKYTYNMRMKRKTQKAIEKSIGTRYPLDVIETMKQLASRHGRSFNSEVIWALREYIARQKGDQHEHDNV